MVMSRLNRPFSQRQLAGVVSWPLRRLASNACPNPPAEQAATTHFAMEMKMPWTADQPPPSMRNLPPKVRRKAVEIANALLRAVSYTHLDVYKRQQQCVEVVALQDFGHHPVARTATAAPAAMGEDHQAARLTHQRQLTGQCLAADAHFQGSPASAGSPEASQARRQTIGWRAFRAVVGTQHGRRLAST